MKTIHPILQKKLYIFDMDGTIYLGNRVFDSLADKDKLLSEENHGI